LDEPVSALDVSIRAQIINLLKKFQTELKLGYLLISHDLATTIHLSHRIAVIYAGKLAESLPATKIYRDARHPYTQALIDAADLGVMQRGQDQLALKGEVPDPLNPPLGCRFHPRCHEQIEKCLINEPDLLMVEEGHYVRCHLAK